MITFTITPKGKIITTRECPICTDFLREHFSLTTNITQKQKNNGEWYHIGQHGRILHKYVLKQLEVI